MAKSVSDQASHASQNSQETAPASNTGTERHGDDIQEDENTSTNVAKAKAKSAVVNRNHTRKRKVAGIDVHQEVAKLQESVGKERLNLVIIGHVDAGKSTLMGHLLYLCGHVDQRDMHKYKSESSKIGKGSFAYAWVLDSTAEERSRGVTIDIAQAHFETEHKLVTVLDAPGHRDFIPNMITGAAQADVAVLVIDATTGGFEAGFERDGQTREHAMLARSLGVTQLVVAVNKLDAMNWEQARFQNIEQRLSEFLQSTGFKPEAQQVIPCSGLTGANLLEPLGSSAPWYTGPTLVQAIDNLKPNTRDVDSPMRFAVADVFKPLTSGLCLAGKVVSGWLAENDPLVALPNHAEGILKSITVDNKPRSIALAGETAVLTVTGIERELIRAGDIVCHDEAVPALALRVRCQIIVFEPLVPLIKGADVVAHFQQQKEPAVLRKLVATVHKATGEILHKHPRQLTANSAAIVDVTFERPVCLEPFRRVKDLGRLLLRADGRTVASGIVLEVKDAVS